MIGIGRCPHACEGEDIRMRMGFKKVMRASLDSPVQVVGWAVVQSG